MPRETKEQLIAKNNSFQSALDQQQQQFEEYKKSQDEQISTLRKMLEDLKRDPSQLEKGPARASTSAETAEERAARIARELETPDRETPEERAAREAQQVETDEQCARARCSGRRA